MSQSGPGAGDTLILYGITSIDDAKRASAQARRIDPRARSIDASGLAAIVGPGASGDVRARLVAHFDLLAAVAAVVDVLPFQFGVLAGDGGEERVREVLASRSGAIATTLARLRGSVEMRVRAQYRQDDVLRDIIRSRPEVRRLRDASRDSPNGITTAEQIRLGRLVVGALERRRHEDGPRLARALRSFATDVRPARSLLETEVLRASFLVVRGEAVRFRRTAESAEADGVRLLVTVTGPLPPWSFIDPASSAATTVGRTA